MIRNFIALCGLMTASSAYSSTPTGQVFGSWRVISINSMSGVDGDDASAMIVQTQGCLPNIGACDELQVSWTQKSDVQISVRVKDCLEEFEDFSASYSVPVDRWLKADRAMENRIFADFTMWLAQAKLACRKPDRAIAFDLRKLKPAVRNFTARLRYFAS